MAKAKQWCDECMDFTEHTLVPVRDYVVNGHKVKGGFTLGSCKHTAQHGKQKKVA